VDIDPSIVVTSLASCPVPARLLEDASAVICSSVTVGAHRFMMGEYATKTG
jgi:hypothetical protein